MTRLDADVFDAEEFDADGLDVSGEISSICAGNSVLVSVITLGLNVKYRLTAITEKLIAMITKVFFISHLSCLSCLDFIIFAYLAWPFSHESSTLMCAKRA